MKAQSGTRHEIAGIVLLAIGAFSTTAILSFQFGSGHLMGPLGHVCARVLYATAGMGGNLIALSMILGAIRILDSE